MIPSETKIARPVIFRAAAIYCWFPDRHPPVSLDYIRDPGKDYRHIRNKNKPSH